jgi:hypothetical protein
MRGRLPFISSPLLVKEQTKTSLHPPKKVYTEHSSALDHPHESDCLIADSTMQMYPVNQPADHTAAAKGQKELPRPTISPQIAPSSLLNSARRNRPLYTLTRDRFVLCSGPKSLPSLGDTLPPPILLATRASSLPPPIHHASGDLIAGSLPVFL